jgi:hypothetical protein
VVTALGTGTMNDFFKKSTQLDQSTSQVPVAKSDKMSHLLNHIRVWGSRKVEDVK